MGGGATGEKGKGGRRLKKGKSQWVKRGEKRGGCRVDTSPNISFWGSQWQQMAEHPENQYLGWQGGGKEKKNKKRKINAAPEIKRGKFFWGG